ncbi:Erf-like ssDNA annealing protein [Escherichia phage vB_EcoS_W011D]|uniref:Putative recombination protein n=1 Tax=Escherichia phage vB_EcoS_W011D TaxID=2575323 RepID=A0A4Y5NV55_9CAUD|nr:Erf-like ssDNA annealing protein [Escherichia phage vB_EcoS_W011D]QCW18512.1 putative recombination protein [Escherichia phage vB_EcoS_W011D]
MKLSEKFDEILPALHKARSQFVKVKKDRQNTHLKNKYATLDSVLDAITPALTDSKLMVMQDMIENHEGGAKLKVETTVIHISGQWAKFYSEIPIVKNDPQGVGSAFTYARRYALAAAFGLSQADDDAQIAVKSAEDWKRDLDKCDNVTDLQEVFKSAYKASDAASRNVIKGHYDKRKADLEIGTARGFSPAAPQQNVAKSERVEPEPKKAVESQSITNFE